MKLNLSFYICNYISLNEANAFNSVGIETGIGTQLWPNLFSRMSEDTLHVMYNPKALKYLLKSIDFSYER